MALAPADAVEHDWCQLLQENERSRPPNIDDRDDQFANQLLIDWANHHHSS